MRHEEEFLPLNPCRDLAEALDHLVEVSNYPPRPIESEGMFVSFEALVEREFELLERIDQHDLLDAGWDVDFSQHGLGD